MDLMYFIRVLYRKKWIILLFSFLSVAATFIYLVRKKPLFVSLAQYSTGFTAEKIKLADGTTAIDLFTVDVKFDNVIETIKSPQVLSRISYSLLLHDLVNPQAAYRRLSDRDKDKPIYKLVNTDTAKHILIEKLATNKALRTDVKNEDLILEYLKLYKYDYESLLNYLSVSRVARTDYLDIIFSSENPELSAWIVNSIGTEFLNYYRQLNTQRTDESAVSIKSLMDAQQQKVDSLSAQLLSEKISQGSIDPVSRTTSAMETVTGIESRLAEEKSKYNLHLNRVNYLTERLNGLQAAFNGSASSDEVIRLTNKKNDLVAELARKGGNDPDLQQQINSLRTEIIMKSNSGSNKVKLKKEIDEVNLELNEEKASLSASEFTLQDYNERIKKYMGMTNVNPGSGVKMDVIKTRLEIENEQLRTVKEKYSQVQGLQKDDPTSKFIQTRVGLPSPEPESKKTLLKMMLAGTIMFILSALVFIFLEIFDSSVKTPLIFSRAAKVRSSHVLNSVSLKQKNVIDIIQSADDKSSTKEESAFKNNIRKLRFDLLNSGNQIFLFTSTKKNTGKTTIIEAVASGLLLNKMKVLIIDCNFTHPSLTAFFNTDIYIQDVLQKVNLNEPINTQNVTGKTTYENLHIIGCKQANVTPAEVFYNSDFNLFLQAFSKVYDFILIEGASLNYYSDTRELIPYVQGIFSVFGADTSFTQLDQDSLKYITSLNDKNRGIILNKVMLDNINS